MSSPRVVLIGPMGAGKSTVGGLLAQVWGTELRDTDRDIETAEGRSVSDIFVDDGEEHFRELERQAVAAALREHTGVLSLGGGAVLAPKTRELLRPVRVVFLQVGLSDAVKRVGLGHGRPLLLGDVRSRVKAILDERLPLYLEAADHVVATDARTADDVADEVRRWVEEQEAARG